MEKGHEKVRLRIYKIYAWGVPLIITSIAAILDNLPKSLHESVLRPRFGEKKCWFAGKCRSINTNFISSSTVVWSRYLFVCLVSNRTCVIAYHQSNCVLLIGFLFSYR